ncbi:hypothetical protein NDU88_003139 [Pleurodeles waltl]|uniref:Uncharacterized protein n=1 Tax=Pleurodeles waltl TaxID=8319 RepID=A0AAV7UY58_PLEWA|nr:hypothetical protein NDU88_003139 [Pleurodeles waltl]
MMMLNYLQAEDGAREQPGAGANQESSEAVTWKGRGGHREAGEEITPVSEADKESGEEEESNGDVGEQFLSRRKEEDEEAAAREPNTASALEKRGNIRCVSTPHYE